MVADDPTCKIQLKTFHSEIQNDHEALKNEEASYKPIPLVRSVNQSMVQRNYAQLKQDTRDIIASEMDRINNDPALSRLVIRKILESTDGGGTEP